MADVQQPAPGDEAGLVISAWWLRGIAVYWIVAAVMLFSTYSGVYQDEAHRVDILVGKGIFTYNGKLDLGRLAALKAEAEADRVCWDAHPKPADQPEPWYPPDCGVYLPRDLIADTDAANWAAAHPGSATAAGWAAIMTPLLYWTLGFLGITLVALGVSSLTRSRPVEDEG